MRCKRCGSGRYVKNGFMKGLQRYRCKACGLNLTDTPPRGMPLRVKVTAVLPYLSGLSMNRTAKLLGVSTPSVMAWIEQFAEAYPQKPEPEGRALVAELDEVWQSDKARALRDAEVWCGWRRQGRLTAPSAGDRYVCRSQRLILTSSSPFRGRTGRTPPLRPARGRAPGAG